MGESEKVEWEVGRKWEGGKEEREEERGRGEKEGERRK